MESELAHRNETLWAQSAGTLIDKRWATQATSAIAKDGSSIQLSFTLCALTLVFYPRNI